MRRGGTVGKVECEDGSVNRRHLLLTACVLGFCVACNEEGGDRTPDGDADVPDADGGSDDGGVPGAPEGMCLPDGWCWTNPIPQGQSLLGAWAAAPDDIWAVGGQGTILHGDGRTWSLVPSGTDDQLIGIWGAAPDDIWTIGAGTPIILHWDGTAWSTFLAGTTYVTAIDGTASNDVWVGAYPGAMLHWDGTAWTTIAFPSELPANAISARTPDDAWAVGHAGMIVHWDGTAWTLMPSGTIAILHAVRTFAADDAWAVGNEGTVLHWDGAAWTTVESGTTADLAALAGAGSDDLWVSGSMGPYVGHYDGTAWTDRTFFRGTSAVAFAQTAADDVWAVGYSGLMAHWDGTAWSLLWRGVDDGGVLSHPWGAADDDIWTVGMLGAIFHWDGAGWSEARAGTPGGRTWAHDVTGTAADDVWAVGEDVPVQHWDGTAWTADPGLTWRCLRAVWAYSRDDVWVVGWDCGSGGLGYVFRRTSGTWGPVGMGYGEPPFTLYAAWDIWGSGPNDVWVVDSQGLAHYTGPGAWSRVAEVGGEGAVIGGTGANDVWVVDADGTIHHWDGTAWTATPAASGAYIGRDLSVVSADDVWALSNSALLHWDGSAWSEVPCRGCPPLTGVWRAPGGDIWVVGDGNAILRRAVP